MMLQAPALDLSFDLDTTAAIDLHLKSQLNDLTGFPTLERIAGGQSNPTYFVSYPNRRLVLRKQPAGDGLPSAHAVDREYRILGVLHERFPAPRALLYCDDRSLVGTPFYVMERVEGTVFADASLPGVSSEFRVKAYGEMADRLADLHALNWRGIGLDGFGRPEGYFARQVNRWTRRWGATQFRELPLIDSLGSWLAKNQPEDNDMAAIVHGDYRMGNLMLGAHGEISAVLDWELSTIGHPLADLAYSCLWWRTSPSEYKGIFGLDLPSLGIPSEAEYLQRYYRRSGLQEPVGPFHFAFSFFRLAIIFEGIARRAVLGNAASTDASQVGDLSSRFAELGLEAIDL